MRILISCCPSTDLWTTLLMRGKTLSCQTERAQVCRGITKRTPIGKLTTNTKFRVGSLSKYDKASNRNTPSIPRYRTGTQFGEWHSFVGTTATEVPEHAPLPLQRGIQQIDQQLWLGWAYKEWVIGLPGEACHVKPLRGEAHALNRPFEVAKPQRGEAHGRNKGTTCKLCAHKVSFRLFLRFCNSITLFCNSFAATKTRNKVANDHGQ
jgi:hypothetical protein